MKRIGVMLMAISLLLVGLVGCAGGKDPAPAANPFDGMTLEEVLDKVYEGTTVLDSIPSLGTLEITAETAEAFLGTSDIDMKEAIASEPMISSIAYSVCLVRMNEGADVEAAAKAIKDGVNPGKWICVQVDPANVAVDTAGDVIILVMSNDYAAEILESFQALKNA
ncbi:hypothetical protein LJC07_03025 [Christensenellaceae bacterium OttesenSCG-928-L17]|nr:hypothetical protein [Christensenellaceae bacterium OttesenSCG-928-L17]